MQLEHPGLQLITEQPRHLLQSFISSVSIIVIKNNLKHESRKRLFRIDLAFVIIFSGYGPDI